jgi:hypothetical protein
MGQWTLRAERGRQRHAKRGGGAARQRLLKECASVHEANPDEGTNWINPVGSRDVGRRELCQFEQIEPPGIRYRM